tara:strand:+ start:6489 stop:8726 length:2238 start_codon:yes stop_codon:yes gene_type:complete
MEFPRQNIPESKKDEQWHKDCIDYFLKQQQVETFVSNKTKDYENYLIASGEFNKEQFRYITDMYGMTAPARLVNYPLIQNKLDLLAGELITQPLQYTVNVINRNAIRRKTEELISIAVETILKPERRKIEEVTQTKIPDEDLGEEIPEDVEQFMKMNYRTGIEKQVSVGLKYLIDRWDLKSTFKRGFYDLQITNKEFYRVYVKNRTPYCERIDPRQMIYDQDGDKESLQDSLYAGVDNWYTVNEIIDRFELSSEEVDKLEELAQQKNQYYSDNNSSNSYITADGNNSLRVRVVDMQWKSIKMINYKVSPNKYDPDSDYHKMVADDYKPKKGEKIVKKAITEVRQAIKVGHEMLIKYGAKPNQIRYEENYANTKLDFYGIIRNNFSGSTLSIVDALKNIQILYNIVMFHIDGAMARSGGKAIVYDVSQKPKNVPLSDIMYHAKNSGLIMINSKQEGGQMSTFNQWKDIDFTLSQSVSQMINLKTMLEETADKLTGITASRAGVNKTSDAVGVNERSVMQSTLITAPLFDIHFKLVSEVLQGMSNLMRYCWGEDGYMVNVFGDMGYEVFNIDKAVALDEYGIFVKNNAKELERKQAMMGLINNFSSTGALDPIATIKAVNGETASELESILTSGLESVQAEQTAMEERKIAAQEQANQINSEKMQIPIQVAQIKAEADLEVAKLNSETKLSIANEELDHNEDAMDVQNKQELDKMMLGQSNAEQPIEDMGQSTAEQESIENMMPPQQ